MAFTSTNIGLRVWDSTSDVFNHIELRDNWNKLDAHDHTSGKGLQIPAAGIADGAVTANKYGASSIANAKIATATIADDKLASPPNVVWKDIYSITGQLVGAVTAANYLVNIAGGFVASTVQSVTPFPLWRPDISGHSATGRTPVLRIVASIKAGTTAPGTMTITPSLFALTTLAGTTSGWTPTIGVANVTVSGWSNPTSALYDTVYGTDTAYSGLNPATPYCLGITTTGTAAAASAITLTLTLQVRNT